MPRAKVAAQRAIALDEELAEAHLALALILLEYDWDWPGAEREVKRAIGLNPSYAEARRLLSSYLQAVGRLDEGLVEIKRARELDPFSFLINRNVGRGLYLARKYDEALAELRQTRDMQPNASTAVDVWIVKSCLKKGLADEAVATDLRIRRNRDGFNAESLDALQAAYSKKGLQGYWTKLKQLALPKFRSTAVGVYRLAEIDTYLGDTDEAFRWLDKAYEYRPNWMPWIKVDPSLDLLRPDPRFSALLRRMGLTP
jgi:tetratricopeptide (TPR) repeat protein